MIEIDNRTYASVHLTDRTVQLWLTNFGNLLATPVNFIAFYLILTKSKREQKMFKYTLFTSHLFFYLSNLFYGTLANVVLLFPFPAICSIGILKNVMNGFWSSLIWICLFALFIFFTFSILIVRLRIVSRKREVFDFPDPAYYVFCVFLFIYILVPITSLWLNAYNPKSVQIQFVETYFPANLNVFDNPSVHVDTSEKNQKAIIFLCIFMIFSGFSIYTFLYVIIIYEIKKQTVSKSPKITQHQKRTVNSALFQIVILGNMIGVSLLLQVRHAFVNPEIDTRIPTALSNFCLIISSIPCQLFMIFRNTYYRREVFRAIGNVSQSTPDNRNSAIFVSSKSRTAI